jgi:antitoxin HicB
MANKHIGSSFASFLDEEGIREEVDLRARKKILADLLAKKKVLAEQMLAKMKRSSVSRTQLATRMSTSRTVINRLLDPRDTSVTFITLAKASAALDLNLLVSLEPRSHTRHRRQKRAEHK